MSPNNIFAVRQLLLHVRLRSSHQPGLLLLPCFTAGKKDAVQSNNFQRWLPILIQLNLHFGHDQSPLTPSCWLRPAEVCPSDSSQPYFWGAVRAVLPSPWLSKSKWCLCFPIYIILSGRKELILHVHSVLGPWAEMASGGLKVVFEKWMFFYQLLWKPHQFANGEKYVAPRTEKNLSAHIFFSVEKPNLANLASLRWFLQNQDTIDIFSPQIASAQKNRLIILLYFYHYCPDLQ